MKIEEGLNGFKSVNGSYILYPLKIHFEPGKASDLLFTTDGVINIHGRKF